MNSGSSTLSLPQADGAAVRQIETVRRNLRSIMIDGIAFSLMVGLGEAYLSAYALALGLSGVAAGMLATAPMLAGAVLQLVSPHAVQRIGSHRRWVLCCASLQTLSLALLPLACLMGSHAGWFLFAVATIYWGTGMATGPAWNTWIENLVPRNVRTRYFAERVRMTQLAVLIGFVVAGVVLQTGAEYSAPLAAFAGLFVAAATCRFISGIALFRQSEVPLRPEDHQHVGFRQWAASLRGDAGGKLLIYLLAVQVAVQISGPYFTPYMIGELKLSYLQYMLLIGVAYVGKVLALPRLGKFSHRFGARKLLWLGGVGIVPVAGLWLVSQSFYWLVCVQLLSGTVWAAYELAMLLMFFESIPKAQRTSVLTIYNLGNAVALLGGATLGGALLTLLGQGPTAYLTLFGLSSCARALTVLLLRRIPDRVAAHPTVPATRIVAVRPASGSDDRPILSTLDDEEDQEAQADPQPRAEAA